MAIMTGVITSVLQKDSPFNLILDYNFLFILILTYNLCDGCSPFKTVWTAARTTGFSFLLVAIMPLSKSKNLPVEKSKDFPAVSKTAPPASTNQHIK